MAAKHQCDSPEIQGRPGGMSPPSYFVAICPHRSYRGIPVAGFDRDFTKVEDDLNRVLKILGEAAELVELAAPQAVEAG